jgi:DNA-binding NarL/FixJ family response regulator
MTTLVLVSDCTVLGMGFEALAANGNGLRFLGVVDPLRAVDTLEAGRPDVLVVDYDLYGGRAVRLCETITRRWPTLPVLVLSSVLDDASVRASIDAGARGFLYKNTDPDELRVAMECLAEGHAILDPKVTARVIQWATQAGLEMPDEGLSGREIEVLRLVSRGEPNKRIARHMGLTENTVKTYLRRAYKKLDCHTRSAAAAAVVQRGLL